MKYLLDTNVIVELFRKRSSTVHHRFGAVRQLGITPTVSTIVLFELHYGVLKSERPVENAQILNSFVFAELDVLPFIAGDALIAGRLRQQLGSKGMPIGPYDLLIAAQALRTGMTLVTANVSEFNRVPDLQWEDWTKDG